MNVNYPYMRLTMYSWYSFSLCSSYYEFFLKLPASF